MGKKYVITIGRDFGSGGKEIGTKLAKTLGIKLIDRNLLEMASIKSGVSEDFFNLADEKVRKRFLDFHDDKVFDYNLITPESDEFLTDKNLFNWQARVLLEMSLAESFVVIGRAADFVLRSTKNCLSVNIQSTFDDCVKSVMDRTCVSKKEAIQTIKKTNKYRRAFYKTYTGQKWDTALNYDICLNTSRINRDTCIDIIIDTAEHKFGFPIRLGNDNKENTEKK